MDSVDPRFYIERLILDCTCEWCGETHWTQEAGTGHMVTDVVKGWFCREVKKNGFVSKHWRVWRVCRSCRTAHLFGQFSKFIFPVIANMPNIDVMQSLVQVQPMQLPAAQVMYMDIVIGNRGAAVDMGAGRDRTVMRPLKQRKVRGRTKHLVMLDDANFRLDAPRP